MGNAITWNELIKVVLFLLGVGVLFYLLLAVSHLVGILKNINKMLDKSRDSINETLEQLPAITENVSKVTVIVKEEMEGIQKIVGDIGKISNTAKDTAEILKNDIVVKAKNILDIIDWLKKFFSDKSGKKKEVVYKYKYKPHPDIVEEEVVTGEDAEVKEQSEPEDTKKESESDGTDTIYS